MKGPIWQWSAVDLAAAIRGKQVSAREATDAVLARIEEKNPHLNALVEVRPEEARKQADQRDAELARGDVRGPLHGVPVSIKVNVDQVGYATTNGVTAFKDMVAGANAPVVDNLDKAGAVFIGRSNTPEFSFRITTNNPLHGLTRNPWGEGISAGGSSGGAGSAAAAGMGPIAHGNDIAGSLRFPSAMNGVATVRPTLGRVPAWNPTQPAERGMLAQLFSVQGTIAREVRDVVLGTRVMAEGDARDPWWVPVPFDGPTLGQPVKVAYSKETYGYAADPEIMAGVEKAARTLEQAGYAVEEVAIPSMEEAGRMYLRLLFGEIKELMDGAIQQFGSETVKEIFRHYYGFSEPVDPVTYMSGIAERTGVARTWNLFLEEYPLVLTPFTMCPPVAFDEDEKGYDATKDLFDSGIYSYGVNLVGLPAAVVPTGLTSSGLPMSAQIIGRRFREDLCLQAASVIEQDVGVLAHQLWQKTG